MVIYFFKSGRDIMNKFKDLIMLIVGVLLSIFAFTTNKIDYYTGGIIDNTNVTIWGAYSHLYIPCIIIGFSLIGFIIGKGIGKIEMLEVKQ